MEVVQNIVAFVLCMLIINLIIIIIIIISSSSSSNRNSRGQQEHTNVQAFWLRTNGVNTNGATANIITCFRIGKRYALALVGETINRSTNTSLCQKETLNLQWPP